MISSSSSFGEDAILNDPAILATSEQSTTSSSSAGAPRIGEPGKRMLGAALGMRHPSLGPRNIGNNHSGGMKDVQAAMSGLTVAE